MKENKIRSIRFDIETEKKIRLLAAEEGISFGEWVRRVIQNQLSAQSLWEQKVCKGTRKEE